MTVAWRNWDLGAGLAGFACLAGLACLVACEADANMPGPDAALARCNPTAPFARWMDLRSINTPDHDEQASLSPDELTLYFSRDDGTGNYDIYQATRMSKTATFENAIAVPGVNTPGEDREPRVTADGLSMFATSRATRAGQFRVTFATRTSTDVPFGPLQNVPVVNGTTNDSDPFISADGRVLYFSSDRSGNYALYRSTQTGGTFSTPELVKGTNLETPYMELTPVLSADELTLYFASSRPNEGSVDIYQATRATVQDAFGEPIALMEVSTNDAELPSWISADGCELYFTRFDPARNLELAVAIRGLR